MTATYGEEGLSYAAINWSYDGSELHNGAIDPIDITHVTCTYKPALPITVVHASHIAVTASDRSALARTVTSVNAIQRIGTP